MAQRPEVILVPVDGSEGANAAARYAAALARPLDVPVRLLFAFPDDALEVLGVPAETVSEEQLESYSPQRFGELRDRRAQHVFDCAMKAIGDPAASVEQVLLAGEPAAAILDYAGKLDAPLIIMGRRGLSRFSEMFVGSVSSRVLHHAHCPVTVVQ